MLLKRFIAHWQVKRSDQDPETIIIEKHLSSFDSQHLFFVAYTCCIYSREAPPHLPPPPGCICNMYMQQKLGAENRNCWEYVLKQNVNYSATLNIQVAKTGRRERAGGEKAPSRFLFKLHGLRSAWCMPSNWVNTTKRGWISLRKHQNHLRRHYSWLL